MSALFTLQAAGVSYGATAVLQDITLAFHPGEFAAITGPNGAGKSTLLALLAGLREPSTGTCRFLDQEASHGDRRAFARRVAVVMQTEPAAFPFTTEDVVFMGRMPHRTGLYENAADIAAVEQAMIATGITPFRARQFRTLSGGERQRALIASALAQSPEVLLLDEPATHLDLQHQVALYRLLRELSRSGLLIIAVTHDLNLGAAYADRLIVMHNGRLRADGTPARVMHPDLIEEVFQVRIALHHTAAGHPWMVYGE